MSTNPSPPGQPAQRGGLPRGPLIVILLALALVLTFFWLKQTVPPRPLPDAPAHRLPPKDQPHPQDPRLGGSMSGGPSRGSEASPAAH